MVSFLHSILLGILQALTEFFPISSSAHLKIAKHLLGVETGVLLDLSCHLGTLCALVIFFKKELLSLFRKEVFLALFPLVPLYFLLKPLREWAGDIHCLGFFLLITGGILLAGQSIRVTRSENRGSTRKVRDLVLIGATQAVALIPGISRSASTISCARILGWEPKEAVRFSFLLSIPTILAGNVWEFAKGVVFVKKEQIAYADVNVSSLFFAFTASFLVGLIVVHKAMAWLEKGNLKPFAWYCFTLGFFALWYFFCYEM